MVHPFLNVVKSKGYYEGDGNLKNISIALNRTFLANITYPSQAVVAKKKYGPKFRLRL